MPKIIADSIDQLISIEMRFAAELPRGVIRPLYEAAREIQGGEPLVYQAARALLERVGQRDTVLIVTGSAPWQRCEQTPFSERPHRFSRSRLGKFTRHRPSEWRRGIDLTDRRVTRVLRLTVLAAALAS